MASTPATPATVSSRSTSAAPSRPDLPTLRAIGDADAMTATRRNPHAGRPFSDDDPSIAAALEDLSVPALLCSMVHVTGDPAWIRGDLRPQTPARNDYQGSRSAADRAEARRRALPAIAAYRDAGCVLPPPPSPELV